jgi:hypothetical protein
MTDSQSKTITINGIVMDRNKARIMLDAAELETKNETVSTDKQYAKEFYVKGYQAATAKAEAEKAELVRKNARI